MADSCNHAAPPEIEDFLRQGFERRADVCHKVHLYTLGGTVLDVRIMVRPQGNLCMARLAGLPNKVVGLWWDAAVWSAFLTQQSAAEAQWDYLRNTTFFLASEAGLRVAIDRAGLGESEKILARLAAHRRKV